MTEGSDVGSSPGGPSPCESSSGKSITLLQKNPLQETFNAQKKEKNLQERVQLGGGGRENGLARFILVKNSQCEITITSNWLYSLLLFPKCCSY